MWTRFLTQLSHTINWVLVHVKKITWGLNIRYKNSVLCANSRDTRAPGVKMVPGPYARREAASCLAGGPPARPPWTSAPGHCLSSASSRGPPGASGGKGRGPLLRWEVPELSVSGKRMFKGLAWVSVSHTRLAPGAGPAPPLSTGRAFCLAGPCPGSTSHWPSYSMCCIDTSCSLFLSNILY